MITFRLAARDLAHEWILALCLVLSLAAVIAPLLLVFGFQYGAVHNLRQQLLEDPRNREITPISAQNFDSNWFGKVKAWPEVDFIVPQTRRLAASLEMGGLNALAPKRLDILPTAIGDPLLAEVGAPQVQERGIVLSQKAAELVGAKRGDEVLASATRNRGGVAERGEVEMKIVAVITNRVTAEEVGYVSLDFLAAVEDYKDGLAVPAFGWSGSTRPAFTEYDGALVFTAQPLSPEQEARLVINTGFARVEQIQPGELPRIAGFQAVKAKSVYHLVAGDTTIQEASLRAASTTLRGTDANVIPWVKPIIAQLQFGSGDQRVPLKLRGLPTDPQFVERLGIDPVLTGEDNSIGQVTESKVLLAPSRSEDDWKNARLIVEGRVGRLEFPILPIQQTNVQADTGWCSVELAGLLRSLDQRPLNLDASTGKISLGRRGFAAFRLYARRLQDVAPLEKRLRQEGIAVITRAERIEDVTALERHLRLVFLMVAGVGLVGGIASLLASLYASVERKRRVFGLLRMMGLPPARLAAMPVYQALVISLVSFGVALLVFYGVGIGINEAMSGRLSRGGKACDLPLSFILMALLVVVFSASLAASVAG